jgi:two-component system, cell cycle sensor histidine kinase and response regulator CckA
MDRPGGARLAALAEFSSGAVMLVNGDAVIEWASPSTHDVLGYRSDVLVGTRARDLIVPEDLAAWQAITEQALEQPGVPVTATVRCRRGDGTTCWTLGVLRNLLNEPRVGGLLLSFTDITSAREIDALLQDSEDRFRQFFEGAADVMFETDDEGYFRFVNPATTRLFGYDAHEILGRRFTEFIRDDHRRRIFEHYRNQSDRREPASYVEFPALAKTGAEIWVGQTAWLVVDARGRFRGMRAVARDITDRLRLDERLRDAQKMEAVGRLAGGIAHDFNNLLAAIRGNAELMTQRIRGDALLAAEVEEILHAADRAATLTRQLLAFSRKQEVTAARVNLNELVDNVTRMARRLIGPNVQLEVRPGSTLRPVFADPSQLEQMLLNLILNARDALPDGGLVVIRTTNVTIREGSAEAVSTGLQAGRYVLLQVSDDGVGMDQATQARIFEPFFTTKEPGRGTGLGLATVYGSVRQMGGAVSVKSARNRGATFSIHIPAAAADESGSTRRSASQEV